MQSGKKLLTNGVVGTPKNSAIARQNKRFCGKRTGLTVDLSVILFASGNRGLVAGDEVLGMRQRRCQRSGEVENTQHLRA
jgi:hypothetical protein